MATFYKYIGTGGSRTYPALDLTVIFGDVVDFTTLNGGVTPDSSWQSDPGPATKAPDNTPLTPPAGPPIATGGVVPAWAATTLYSKSQAALDPTGNLIVRIAGGTSRSTYDATEQAAWTTVSSVSQLGPAIPTWTSGTSYTAGQVVMHPTTSGLAMRRLTSGVARNSFDATEQALWVFLGSATYVAASVAPAPSGDTSGATDYAALQAWLNTSTSSAPLWLSLQKGHYYINTALVFPFAPGTRLSGAGKDVSIIEQVTAGQAIIRFTTADTHTIHWADFTLQYPSAQSNAASQAVTYEGTAGQSYYHHTYDRIRVKYAYDCWAIVNPSGPAVTVWDAHWSRCDHYHTKHRVLSFVPFSADGMPSVTFDRVGVYNTGGGVTPTSAAFYTLAAELAIEGLDIEGWDNEIAHVTGGGGARFKDVHVESHTFSSGTRLIYFSDSHLDVDALGLSGTSAGAGGNTGIVTADNGTASITGIRSALTVSSGGYGVAFQGSATYTIGSVQVDGGTTTPTLWLSTTTNPELRWYPAGAWKDASGSPSFVGNGGGSRFPAWLLADAVTQQIDIGFEVPAHWGSFDILLYWSHPTATSGAVALAYSHSLVAVGGDLTTGDVNSSSLPTASSANLLTSTTLFSGVANGPGLRHLRLSRAGSDGSDTLADTMAVLGLMLRRAA